MNTVHRPKTPKQPAALPNYRQHIVLTSTSQGDKAGTLRLRMESQRSLEAKNVAMRGLLHEDTQTFESYDPDSPVKGGEVS